MVCVSRAKKCFFSRKFCENTAWMIDPLEVYGVPQASFHSFRSQFNSLKCVYHTSSSKVEETSYNIWNSKNVNIAIHSRSFNEMSQKYDK